MSRKKIEAIAHIKVYRPKITRVGRLVLKVYEPVPEAEALEKITIKTKKDAIDAIYDKVQKEKRKLTQKFENALIEVDVEGRGFALHLGENTEKREELKNIELIFPRPAKLNRIGLMQKDKIRWLKPKKGEELYVYEGFIEIPKEISAVILETELGTRIIRNTQQKIEESKE